ncbi:protein kinase [Streptomyces sp. NPDC006296]|uniref:protein kinase domain-containing protein n=1 Tax=Streptomyces sp. NPDC006296 TaxID=3156746 RepID=UPI0033A36556
MQPLADSDPVRISRYRLAGRLGAGGMGSVYLGSTPGGRPVAIKVISDQFQYEEQALERFRREVGTLRSMRSAYSASLIDSGLDAPPYWFATEYVPGRTLDSAVRTSGPLPVRLGLGLMAALAEGLSDIHVHGILHRDVKPQNIILSPVGPQLIDFGIARETGQTALTQVGHTAGSPGFTSPEALQGEEVGVPADVFALGATLAFAATGRPPYGGGSFPAVAYRTVHGEIDLDGIDPALAEIIAACTDRDPARRPAPEEIVERCQSDTSLANDPSYQRIAASGSTDGLPALPPAPTVLDASADSRGVPLAAAPTQVVPALPAAPTTPPDSPAPTAVQPAGTHPATAPAPVAVPPLKSSGTRPWRRKAVVAVAAVAVVCTVGAVLVTFGMEGSGGSGSGPKAGSSPSEKATEPDGGAGGAADPVSEQEEGQEQGQDQEQGEQQGQEEELPEERVINSPMSLRPGDEISAAKIRLVLQRDGGLVAYDELNQARWDAWGNGAGTRADFQPDGNFVVYNAEDQAVWASQTDGHENAVLKLQSDGNITVVDGDTILWAAGTNH